MREQTMATERTFQQRDFKKCKSPEFAMYLLGTSEEEENKQKPGGRVSDENSR